MSTAPTSAILFERASFAASDTVRGIINIKIPEDVKVTQKQRDIVFLVDVSGSMKPNMRLTRKAVDFLLRQLEGKARASIVAFANDAEVLQGFETKRTFDVQELQARGCTNLMAAFEVAKKLFSEGSIQDSLSPLEREEEEEEKEAVQKMVLLLTDGEATAGTTTPRALLEIAQSIGVSILSVALGHETNDRLLQSMASTTGGMFAKIQHANNLLSDLGSVMGAIFGTVHTGCQVQLQGGAPVSGYLFKRGLVHVGNVVVGETIKIPFLGLTDTQAIKFCARNEAGEVVAQRESRVPWASASGVIDHEIQLDILRGEVAAALQPGIRSSQTLKALIRRLEQISPRPVELIRQAERGTAEDLEMLSRPRTGLRAPAIVRGYSQASQDYEMVDDAQGQSSYVSGADHYSMQLAQDPADSADPVEGESPDPRYLDNGI